VGGGNSGDYAIAIIGMQLENTGSNLFFGTAGIPHSIQKSSTIEGIKQIKKLNLDCMELEFVQGIYLSAEKSLQVKEVAEKNSCLLSAHAPYYINLNSRDYNFTCVGLIEIPQVDNKENINLEKINLIFSNSVNEVEFLGATPTDNVNIKFEYLNYLEKELGNEGMILDFKSSLPLASKYFETSPTLNSISYVPGGILHKEKIYRKESINLDTSSMGDIISSQPISYLTEEFLRLENSLGDVVLRNITFSPSGPINFTITSERNIICKKIENYSVLLNPDFIIITFIPTNTVYRVKTSDYIQAEATSIQDLSLEASNRVSSTLSWGTDIYTNEVCTIFSDTRKKSNWFLQKKYFYFLKNIKNIGDSGYSYSVKVHNSKIFILQEYIQALNRLRRTLAVDYLGNILEIKGEYLLDIDGAFILKEGDNYYGYKGDLTKKVKLSTSYYLYYVYPSFTETLFSTQTLDLKKVIICRDRLQEIN